MFHSRKNRNFHYQFVEFLSLVLGLTPLLQRTQMSQNTLLLITRFKKKLFTIE